MGFRPAEALKSVATELAALISSNSNDLERINNLLKELPAGCDNIKDHQPGIPVTNTENDRIGIWEKKIKNGRSYYCRDLNQQREWALWADIHNIYPKEGQQRIVLLGESVARGYLYDPYYNVATELQAILNDLPQTKNTEVVDLARISLQMDGLIDMVKVCAGLEPDMVVIFAGNNWVQDLVGLLQSENDLIDHFKKDGLKSIQAILEANFTRVLDKFLQEVKTSLTNQQIPVIFIIPEFNLNDWRSDEIEHGVLWLPENKTQTWLQAKEAAEKARNNNDIVTWENAAMDMINEDFFNPIGHELLADAYVVQKQWKKARARLECAKDLALYRGGNPAPRCNGFVRKKMLSDAEQYGIQVIDLPSVFEEHINNGIPGRSLFLDYCHLSVEGIKIAMRYTAQKIIEVGEGIKKSIQEIKESDIMPAPEVLSVAHFAAAIHNAHYGQSPEILQYHCSKSLAHSSTVIDLMENFIDFSNRKAPTILCEKFEEVILDGRMRQYEGGLKLNHQRARKLMDLQLTDILCEQIESLQPGITQKVSELRITEHGLGETPSDLMESFYSRTGYNEFRLAPKHNFLKVRSLTSSFFFIVGPETAQLKFEFTYRSPVVIDDKSIKVYINNTDRVFQELPLSKEWNTVTFLVTRDNFLLNGVNKLYIQWPYLQTTDDLNNVHSFNSFIEAVYPVFGEIYSLTAQVV